MTLDRRDGLIARPAQGALPAAGRQTCKLLREAVERRGWGILILLVLAMAGCIGDLVCAQGQPTRLELQWREILGSARMGEDGIWLGYGLELPLDPNALLIQGLNMNWGGGSIEFGGSYLDSLIGTSGGPGQLSIAPGEVSGGKVKRKVAVLLGVGTDRELDRVVLVNRELPVELGEREFRWMGESDLEESLSLLQALFRSSRETRVQKQLLSTVAWYQTAAAAATLRENLQAEEVELRLEAVRGLRHFPNPSTVDLLRDLARRGEQRRVRAEAVTILSRMPGVTRTLLGLLDPGDDREVQSRLVAALARSGDPEAVAAVFRIVETADAPHHLRREAVVSLSRQLDPAAIEPRLVVWASESPSEPVRQTAVAELGRRFLPGARSVLLRVIGSEEERPVLAEAVEALLRLPSAEAASLLGDLAQRDSRSIVRLEAVRGLGKLRQPATVPLLEKVVLGDSERMVQATAVEVLRGIPGEEALEALIRTAESHPDSDIRRRAVRQMAHLAGELVAQKLIRIARQDPERGVQSEAIGALRQLGTEAAIRALVQIAHDHPVYDQRRRAIQELGRSDSPIARAALLEMVQSRN